MIKALGKAAAMLSISAATGRYVARYRLENGIESPLPDLIRTLVPQQRGYRYLWQSLRVVYIYAPPGSCPG